jgi:single-strand selective monofunctional uracil DNA glycosylase
MHPLVSTSRKLTAALAPLKFPAPVAAVYNPLDYARANWEHYLETWLASPREVLLLGMNPGPFGMAQTGVPFGDPTAVRELLGISGPVGRPAQEHPKRPVEGFALKRQEVSGTRLWGWAAARDGGIEAFFRRFGVINYCPLLFLAESGRNLTPEVLPSTAMAPVEAACDEFLASAITFLDPRWLVGVGAFAEKVLRRVAADQPQRQVARILHPSPASPAANRDWAGTVTRQLAELGIEK